MEHEFSLGRCRREAGYTQKELAAALGVPFSTYRSWEYKTVKLTLENAISICNVLGCTPNNLAGIETMDPSLTDDESRLVRLYRSTDARGRETIMAVAESQSGEERASEADDGACAG